MAFLKHIGKHSGRNIAILYRQVPNEDHMCLVVYPEVLPAPWHDAIMKVIESDIGQQAEELANALHRNLLPDGRAILETLHLEKMIKKVRTADVTVTPSPNAKIRLDELNTMLNEMKQGEAAIKRLAESDASRGMVAPEVKRSAEAAYKATQQPGYQTPSTDGALDDRTLAANMLTQAQRMELEAKGLLAEAARMKKDAERMHPGVVTSESSPATSTATTAPKRGRPSKAKVAADAAQ
jgi:hypothetical protein